MSQLWDEFSHPETRVPLRRPKGRGEDRRSPGSHREMFVQASKPASGTNVACLPGMSPQEGFPVSFAPGQQLPRKVLFSVRLRCSRPKVRRRCARATAWHPQEAAVQVQLPFGAKVQFSAALLFPWGSFKLG